MQLLQPPDNRPMLFVRRPWSRMSHLLFLSFSFLWQFGMTFSKYWRGYKHLCSLHLITWRGWSPLPPPPKSPPLFLPNRRQFVTENTGGLITAQLLIRFAKTTTEKALTTECAQCKHPSSCHLEFQSRDHSILQVSFPIGASLSISSRFRDIWSQHNNEHTNEHINERMNEWTNEPTNKHDGS